MCYLPGKPVRASEGKMLYLPPRVTREGSARHPGRLGALRRTVTAAPRNMIRKENRSTAQRKADTAFSLYIRTRDAQPYEGRAFRCISCQRVLPIDQADCGHYINRQHNSLRYSEENCNAQCRNCNRFDEGNIQGYRKGLIQKIGEQRVELLEAMKYRTNKLSAFDLSQIAAHYRKELNTFNYQIR